MLNRSARQRLHIRSIDELPGEFDEEIADLFREMREATGMSLDDLSARLNTSPSTVHALERGDMRGLPAWPETSRVVVAYAELLSLDPDPVLRRIMLQLPQDHPRRPRTAEAAPSYADVRSNIDAALSRVPNSETPMEHKALPASSAPPAVAPASATPAGKGSAPRKAQAPQQPRPAHAAPPPLVATGPASAAGQQNYADLRAIPGDARWSPSPYPPQQPARNRKSRRGGFGVALLQLLLLLLLLASGYAMWLAMNDPQAFAALKAQLESGLQPIVDWATSLIGGA